MSDSGPLLETSSIAFLGTLTASQKLKMGRHKEKPPLPVAQNIVFINPGQAVAGNCFATALSHSDPRLGKAPSGSPVLLEYTMCLVTWVSPNSWPQVRAA